MNERPHRASAALAPHLIGLACAASMACASGAAHAHPVQKCIVDGAPVFQSAPCLHEAVNAPPTPPAVARRAEGVSKRKTLAETLRDHDAADRPAHAAREPIGDGASVLPERMGAR